jgi:phytoene dehydrogenase-like protein
VKEVDVVIIGGGVSGLCTARLLGEAGLSCVLAEASDKIGGCLRTDLVDGFLLDRGFQVYLTAYSEPSRYFDVSALGLKSFINGALVRREGAIKEILDPWSYPLVAPRMFFNGIGSLRDKFLLLRLRRHALSGSVAELFERPATSTFYYLRKMGFSEEIVEEFFRPFFGAVFLDNALETSSRMFEYVFRLFATGQAALPNGGMAAVTQEIAKGLPEGTIRLRTKVRSIEDGKASVERGEKLKGRHFVVATGGKETARLCSVAPAVEYRSVCCLYYAASQSPVEKPLLVLGSDEGSLISSVAVPSLVNDSYAPAPSHLIATTVLGAPAVDDKELERLVRKQLFDWFGAVVREWKHLRTYRIADALPSVPATSGLPESFTHCGGLYLVGDYFGNASIEGAMLSARGAVEAILQAREG